MALILELIISFLISWWVYDTFGFIWAVVAFFLVMSFSNANFGRHE